MNYFQHIDHPRPKKDWMDTPVEIRRGCTAMRPTPKALKRWAAQRPRGIPLEDDWKLPDNWQQILHEGFKERLEKFRSFKVFMDICVRCGACADKCHFSSAPATPRTCRCSGPNCCARSTATISPLAGKILGRLAGARR
jgi:ferredoxin